MLPGELTSEPAIASAERAHPRRRTTQRHHPARVLQDHPRLSCSVSHHHRLAHPTTPAYPGQPDAHLSPMPIRPTTFTLPTSTQPCQPNWVARSPKIRELPQRGNRPLPHGLETGCRPLTNVRQDAPANCFCHPPGGWRTGGWRTGGWRTGGWRTGGWRTGGWRTGGWRTGGWRTGGWRTGGWRTGGWRTGGWRTGGSLRLRRSANLSRAIGYAQSRRIQIRTDSITCRERSRRYSGKRGAEGFTARPVEQRHACGAEGSTAVGANTAVARTAADGLRRRSPNPRGPEHPSPLRGGIDASVDGMRVEGSPPQHATPILRHATTELAPQRSSARESKLIRDFRIPQAVTAPIGPSPSSTHSRLAADRHRRHARPTVSAQQAAAGSRDIRRSGNPAFASGRAGESDGIPTSGMPARFIRTFR